MSNDSYTLDFNALAAGTTVDDEFAKLGLSIYAYRDDEKGEPNKAMIFDTANPTGGDDDLATDNLEKVLIISEDGDAHDPDDNGDGGVIEFKFDTPTHVEEITILDFEEGGRIKLFDDDGNLLKTVHVSSPNNGQKIIDLDTDGVARMKVELHGSGAVDNLVFSNANTSVGPDGAVDGEAFGEDMALGYDDSNAPTDQGGDIITNDADLIYGNGGGDTIDGAEGDDTIFGDDGGQGSTVTTVRESFEWDKLDDPNGSGDIDDGDPITNVTQNTGNVDVSFRLVSSTANADHEFSDEEQNVAGIDDGPETIDDESGFNSDLTGDSHGAASYELSFSDPVENVDFRINDIDGSGTVTVRAFDADGNEIAVDLTAGSGLNTIGSNTVTTANLGDYEDEDSPNYSVLVQIAGPVARIEIDHSEGDFNSGVWITDVYFDAVEGGFDPGVPGDDVITGGGGADEMYGEDGDDTFIVDNAADGSGDDIIGGNGPDDTADNDVLDLRGAGQVDISAVVDGTDAGAIRGTVTFKETGETLTFRQIETILTDPQNEAPTAVDDIVDVDEDDSVTFNPTANDIDPDGDPLEVVDISDPSNGTLIDNGDGTYTYEPDPDYNGPDSVTYTVQDPSGEQSTATITFNVAPVNDPPDAVNDVASTDEEVAITLTPLDNDTDVDGDDLIITGASVPAEQGMVMVSADGKTIEYVPADDFFGEATISYAISDGNGGTDTAEISVTVNNINDAPTAVDDIASTMEDEAVVVDLLGNDTDPDGDPLEIASVSVPPEQGSVVDNGDGTVTFTPALNFNGPATITYTVSDGNGGTDTGEAVVSVGAVNDGPTAVDDTATTDEDTPVTINVIANDTDPDGDVLEVVGASVPAEQGTVVNNGDGTITFTPAPDYNGPAEITYTITDNNGGTDTGTVDVTVNPVNDAPIAVDDIETTDEDVAVVVDLLGNDVDPDGDPLEIVSLDVDPAVGSVVDNGDGTVTFTPAPNYNGPATITYVVSDGNGGTDTGQAVVSVGAVNDSPEAVDDSGATDQGTPVTIDVLSNDSDPDGDILEVISATVPADQGTVVNNGDGTVTFTPAPAFVGTATITYTIADGNGGTDTALVSVDVADVIGPVDGLDTGENMQPGYTDVEGDQIDGTDGNDDTIFGNGGDDTIDSGEGDDTVDGGAGDDVFEIANSGNGIDNDVIIGGETDEDGVGDVLDMGDITEDLTVDITAPEEGTVTDGVDTTTFEEIERIITGSGDDVITGSDGDDYVDSQGGDDKMEGGAGNDTLISGDGDDTIDGGAGDDSLVGGDEFDSIMGGAGNDTIEGGRGADELDGGDGDDSIVGGNDSDTITGGDGADVVEAGEGDNVIDTSGSTPLIDDKNGDGFGFGPYGPLPPIPADTDEDDDRDFVTAGSGDDTITTGDDADTIFGGSGDNVIDSGIDNDEVTTTFGNDFIVTGGGSDTVSSGAGDDTIFGGLGPNPNLDIFNIPDEGSFPNGGDPDTENGRDSIEAGAGQDLVFGQDDDDTIRGGGGADTLDGGIDDDSIFGDAGQDDLIGGQGADTMFGGADRDEFLIDNREDAFGDIADGGTTGNDVDRLDLRGLGRFEIVNETVDADGDSTSGTVNFLDADGNIEGTLEFREIENLIPCFTPGAMIATPRGEVAVEALTVGDRVITRDDGIQEIQWIGKKKLSGQDMLADPKLKPVLIKAGALGNGLPERDMLVSPNHRMLIANENTQMLFDEREVLVAAKHLVGQPGVHQIDVLGTEYIHVMFDRHQVILGDGAWTESFQPGDQTLGGFDAEQREEIFKLFPSLKGEKGRRAYGSARQSLKAFEARTLRETMGSGSK